MVAWVESTAGGTDIQVAAWEEGSGLWIGLGSSLGMGGISGTGTAGAPQIVVNDLGVAVFWIDAGQVYGLLYNGAAWVELGTGSASGGGISNAPVNTFTGDLAVDAENGRFAVAWSQKQAPYSRDQVVYLREYTVGGGWGELGLSATGFGVSIYSQPEFPGAATINHASQPSLAYHEGSLFLGYRVFADQGVALAVLEWDGGGWISRGLLSAVDLPSSPRLAAAASQLHAVWIQQRHEGEPDRLFALKWNSATNAFVEEIPGDASADGVSRTTGDANRLALAVDSQGDPFIAWEEAYSGTPEILVRGDVLEINRTFFADGSVGGSIQSILDFNDLGP